MGFHEGQTYILFRNINKQTRARFNSAEIKFFETEGHHQWPKLFLMSWKMRHIWVALGLEPGAQQALLGLNGKIEIIMDKLVSD